MKRSVIALAILAAVTLMTVAAQAESKGEQIFKQKCTMCHVVHGKGGTIGPDLSKIAATKQEKQLRAQLDNPKKNNPNSSMPSFKTLPKADLDALIGYLKTLK